MSASYENSYDRIPYVSKPYADTHPWRAAAVATMFDLRPAPVEQCSVLELGCAVGGNLIPMASSFPNSRFVGIDLSQRQISLAQAGAGALALGNIEFKQLSITDIGPDFGQFDYIICHGVFSWVPQEVREAILRVCRENLAPTGVAYVSFNTYPGWLRRRWARDLMRFHSSDYATEAEQLGASRAIVKMMADSPMADAPTSAMLRAERDDIADKPDEYILHEYLEEVNEPMYFRDFAAMAQRHRLAYLGDARINGTVAEETWPPARPLFSKTNNDLIRTEQYADFLRNRMFRHALLVHHDVAIDRSVAGVRMQQMRVCSPLRRDPSRQLPDAVMYVHPRGGGVGVPRKDVMALLDALERVYPEALGIDELCERAGIPASQQAAMAIELTTFWLTQFVEAYVSPPKFATTVGDRPIASPVARFQAQQEGPVTTLRHESANLNPAARHYLMMCDGTRTRAELLKLLSERVPGPDLAEWAERAVPKFARSALFVG